MSYSLNEIEATAKRATRGCGYSWGLAEEAGKATRWLCANGLDGCAILANLLEHCDGQSLADMAPQTVEGDWTGVSDRLSPLSAGVTLSDCAQILTRRDIILCNVVQPGLVLPFAAAVARQIQQVVTVGWGDITVACDASGRRMGDAKAALATPLASQLRVQLGGRVADILPAVSRVTPAVADWQVLNRFAHRIYAPATEASRLLGAGAGLSDND